MKIIKTILQPKMKVFYSNGIVLENKTNASLIITPINTMEFDIETFPKNAKYELTIVTAQKILTEVKPFVSYREFKKITKRINKKLGIKIKLKIKGKEKK